MNIIRILFGAALITLILTQLVNASDQEAPMLAKMVKAGKLPPLAQRLPKDILVIKPENAIGQYGGKLRGPHGWDVYFEQGLLQRLHSDRDTFMPQIAKSWEWGDDYKSITFHLREGMKWSDGHPYTTNDILFWWNEIVQSKYNLKPYNVSGLNSETDTLVKVNDYEFRFEFAEPRPSFLVNSRGAWSYGFYGFPAHYFKKFHPDYNNTASNKAQEVFEKLLDTLDSNQWIVKEPNAPTVNAWKSIDFKEGQYVLFERNPYYFGVDPKGNQLPYIDYIEGLDKYDKDAELMKAKTLAGEVDMLFRVVRPSDFPLFKEKSKEIGLQIILLSDVFNGKQTFQVNQEYTGNVEIKKLLQNVDFRRALSLGLDRELMNESIYLGLGKPGHGFSDAGIFDKNIDGSYATRDLAAANALLDSIGLDQRDSDGFRMLSNGEKLTLILLFRSGWGAGANETAEIATDNWQQIGLRFVGKPMEKKAFKQQLAANKIQITMRPETGGWSGYWKYGLSLKNYAQEGWAWMKSNKSRGIKPHGKLKDLAQLQWQANTSQDKKEAANARQKFREIMADQLFQIGTVCNTPAILVLNEKLQNIPGQVESAAISQGESEYLRFEQWYFEK